jgi:hypothetical protein
LTVGTVATVVAAGVIAWASASEAMKQKALKMTIKRKAESMVITCGEWR